MLSSERLRSLIIYFIRSIAITASILLLLIIINYNYLEIRKWWDSYSYFAICFFSGLIILRWLYKKIIHQQ